MKKEKYESPVVSLQLLDVADIITASGEGGSLGWDTEKEYDSGGWT